MTADRLIPKDEQIGLLRAQVLDREHALARIADDARAALGGTTYARMEYEHRLMSNTLFAVAQALGKRRYDRDAVLLAVAENALSELIDGPLRTALPGDADAADAALAGSRAES